MLTKNQKKHAKRAGKRAAPSLMGAKSWEIGKAIKELEDKTLVAQMDQGYVVKSVLSLGMYVDKLVSQAESHDSAIDIDKTIQYFTLLLSYDSLLSKMPQGAKSELLRVLRICITHHSSDKDPLFEFIFNTLTSSDVEKADQKLQIKKHHGDDITAEAQKERLKNLQTEFQALLKAFGPKVLSDNKERMWAIKSDINWLGRFWGVSLSPVKEEAKTITFVPFLRVDQSLKDVADKEQRAEEIDKLICFKGGAHVLQDPKESVRNINKKIPLFDENSKYIESLIRSYMMVTPSEPEKRVEFLNELFAYHGITSRMDSESIGDVICRLLEYTKDKTAEEQHGMLERILDRLNETDWFTAAAPKRDEGMKEIPISLEHERRTELKGVIEAFLENCIPTAELITKFEAFDKAIQVLRVVSRRGELGDHGYCLARMEKEVGRLRRKWEGLPLPVKIEKEEEKAGPSKAFLPRLSPVDSSSTDDQRTKLRALEEAFQAFESASRSGDTSLSEGLESMRAGIATLKKTCEEQPLAGAKATTPTEENRSLIIHVPGISSAPPTPSKETAASRPMSAPQPQSRADLMSMRCGSAFFSSRHPLFGANEGAKERSEFVKYDSSPASTPELVSSSLASSKSQSALDQQSVGKGRTATGNTPSPVGDVNKLPSVLVVKAGGG